MEKFVHGGNIYTDVPVGGWTDFSANINPLGISDIVRAAIADNIAGLVNYPDPDGKEAKKAIADFYKLLPENIILGNGAVEILYLFFHICQPKNVLLPVPSFSEYERAALAGNTNIIYYQLSPNDDFNIFFEEFIKKLAFFDCTIIGNPNNPTGNLLTADQAEKIIRAARKTSTMVIMDESFVDFLMDEEKYSVKSLSAKYDNLLVIQSLTKFYALPGLRLGFAVSGEKMIKKLEQQKDPWNMNFLAQKAVVAALKDEQYQKKSRLYIKNEQDYLLSELRSIPAIECVRPSANFILLDIQKTGLSSAELTDRMRKKGILIRNCDNYPGLNDNYVRIAIKSRKDNKTLLEALKGSLT